MDLQDSAALEKDKEKQKRAEGGVSPDLKRARLAELYRAQIPEDTEMESQGKKYEDDDNEDEYVEDEDEYVDEGDDDDDDDDDDEEEEQQQEMDFTEPEKPPEMPQEHKDYIRKVNESLIQKFGTADSLAIDIILRKRAWKEEEEERNKVKEEETEEEKKEKIKIEEILNHVDSLTVFHNDGNFQFRTVGFQSGTVGFQSGTVGNLKFFLLSPWTDVECTKYDMTVRSLDMYYKRLMPNTESACRRFSPSLWNSLPEVDAQYVLLYNKLDTLYQQKSWASFSREMTPKDLCKAEDEANALNLRNLGEFDISECLNDVFMERDTIAEHKLRTEYDLYLLECLLHKKRPEDFIIDDPSEISHNPARFCPPIQQGNFFTWMDRDNVLEKTEEECKRLIVERQEKKLAECCSPRIRYVKFKRALAKDLKIISGIFMDMKEGRSIFFR